MADEKHLLGESRFPAAVAAKPAADALYGSIAQLKSVSGFGFGSVLKDEQARVLRVLADQIENGGVIVQGLTFEEMTDVGDFVMFRWSIRFAERTPPTENDDKKVE